MPGNLTKSENSLRLAWSFCLLTEQTGLSDQMNETVPERYPTRGCPVVHASNAGGAQRGSWWAWRFAAALGRADSAWPDSKGMDGRIPCGIELTAPCGTAIPSWNDARRALSRRLAYGGLTHLIWTDVRDARGGEGNWPRA
jgi:hypothetical protein